MYHLEQQIPHSTKERKEDPLISRAFSSLASQRVIIQEAVVSTDASGYGGQTVHRQLMENSTHDLRGYLTTLETQHLA